MGLEDCIKLSIYNGNMLHKHMLHNGHTSAVLWTLAAPFIRDTSPIL